MKKTKKRSMFGISDNSWRGAAIPAILLVCAGAAHADPVNSMDWTQVDAGTAAGISTLGGMSEDHFYFSSGVNIHQYDPETGGWEPLQSWAAFRTNSTYWSSVNPIWSTVAGEKIYVTSTGSPSIADPNYVAYFDGTSWTNLPGTRSRWYAPAAVGGATVINIGLNGSFNMPGIKIVDGTVASGFPKSNISYTGPNPNYAWFSIDGNDDGVFWAKTGKALVARSVDDGETWTEVSLLPASAGVNSGGYAIVSLDATHAIACIDGGAGVYRTGDGGSTWDAVAGSTPIGGSVRGIYAEGWDDIFAFGAFAGLYHWDGVDWTHVELPGHSSANTLWVMVNVGGRYWIAGNNGVLYARLVHEPTTMIVVR